MKKKYTDILHYLCDHENPITSKELANALHISIRSVKNYINILNLMASEKMITSSNKGYYIHVNIAKKLLSIEKKQLPQTSEERTFFIVKQLLIHHAKAIDIYELCDTLFVSYSTIKADITKMNKAFSNFRVEFLCENDAIKIVGSEKNKRKLVSYVMYEETNNNFMNADIIKDSFKTINIDKVSSIIFSTFDKYHYYINDFAYINLLLHFAIIIDRLKEGNYVNTSDEGFSIEDEKERNLVSDLSTQFEQEFDITFTKNELFEIYMLFRTNANHSIPSSQETLKKIVGEQIILLATDIVGKVNDYYYINLESENFLTPFALHLKNLILRLQRGSYTKNPMTQSIQTSCPTVYDIAIYISYQLMQEYKIDINEDEVTFLALHIGAEIERQKINDEKVKCILLCPDYMKISTQIYNQLLIEFGHQIDIIKTISNEDELHKYSFDMCISIIPIKQNIHREVVLIPPFLKESDKNHVYEIINHVHINRKNWILKSQFHQFFSKELFIANPTKTNRDEIIHILSNAMLKLHYVNKGFEERVQIREHAASTGFGNIAIPHTMKMDALKTCISVCVSKQGIQWGNQLVHVVLLIAINKADKRIFHELYEALVELFSNDKVIQATKHCSSFGEFEQIIFENITIEHHSIKRNTSS